MHVKGVSTHPFLLVDLLHCGLVVVKDHSWSAADVHRVSQLRVDLIEPDNIGSVVDSRR